MANIFTKSVMYIYITVNKLGTFLCKLMSKYSDFLFGKNTLLTHDNYEKDIKEYKKLITSHSKSLLNEKVLFFSTKSGKKQGVITVQDGNFTK